MIKIAEAINSFAREAEQADVSSEESVFALTGSQIQEIITRVIQPLQGEVSQLKATVANLEGKVSDLEATQDSQAENELNMLRLINDLRKKPTKNQENRIEVLRSLLAAHGGKMLTKEARNLMGMDKGAFSRLLDVMPEYVDSKPYHLDKKQIVLVLR